MLSLQIRSPLICFTVFTVILTVVACTPARPTPTPSAGDMSITESTTRLADQLVRPLEGACVGAFYMVNQTIEIPAVNVQFDVNQVIDRFGISMSNAIFTFQVQPAKPISCDPQPLIILPETIINFGINYQGDLSRLNPFCMNASKVEFTDFSITGTPFDNVVEDIVKEKIWEQIDRYMASQLHNLLVRGEFPVDATGRCNNWVDMDTLSGTN